MYAVDVVIGKKERSLSLEDSKAYRLTLSQGWAHRITSSSQVNLELCPISGCDNYHFFISTQSEKDGLWKCHRCGQEGNLYELKEYLGIKQSDRVVSLQDAARSAYGQEPLPDYLAAHNALMKEAEDESVDEPAIDYLIGRGFSIEVIERLKLGLSKMWSEKNGSEVKALLIPYLSKGKIVSAKYRTLPPALKDFRGVTGREARLFNEDAVTAGMKELIAVEGELDCVSGLSNGIENIVGVPGADVKKAAWLTKLDNAAPERIYLLYDNDEKGQSGARKIAERIGLSKCWNVLLPEEVNGHKIKDLNEFFVAGGTVEQLDELKQTATQFHVEGVVSVGEVVEKLRTSLVNGENLGAKYKTQFERLNRLIKGFVEGDLIGIHADAKCGKTKTALNILDFLVREYGEPGLFHCEEMLPEELVKAWVCMKTETPDDELTVESMDTALSMAAAYPADLLFAYTAQRKFSLVADTIRQAVRRYGCKFVVFDNLQLLTSSRDNWTQEIASNANAFKALAMELKIVLILVIQPHALKEGQIATSDTMHGSSQIKKAVDMVINLHRDPILPNIKGDDTSTLGHIQIEQAFSPVMFCYVDRSRRSPGGTCTLYFDGAKSKVYSEDPTPVIKVLDQPLVPAFDEMPIAV